MDNNQTKLVPSPDTCNDERIYFRDLSNIQPTTSENSVARVLPELKREGNLNDLTSVTSGIPNEIEKSWQKSISSLNNLFSEVALQNSTTKFDEDVDFEKDQILLAPILTDFKYSVGMANKNETVNVNPVPMPPILKRSIEREDVHCKKQSIPFNNKSIKRFKYKHTYFDSDGQEIDGSNQTNTNLLHLSSGDKSKADIPPMISTHFNGKCKEKRQTVYHFESWFSVVPESVAEHIANRCRSHVIIDGFCGAGGNAIQFAMKCKKVIAIDIDMEKIEMAKYNATIYGVNHRIEFIVGNFLALVDSLKADVIFLSPPWGGWDFSKEDVYDVETALTPVSASELVKISRKITQNIVIYLPRNSNIHQLAKLAGPERPVEIEKCSLDGELIAIAAYYGTLFIKQ